MAIEDWAENDVPTVGDIIPGGEAKPPGVVREEYTHEDEDHQ
jgi:hypothetical protein